MAISSPYEIVRDAIPRASLAESPGRVVLVNGYLDGLSNSILSCLKFANAKTMWRLRGVGRTSLTYSGDKRQGLCRHT
jgi:hypothetical protein